MTGQPHPPRTAGRQKSTWRAVRMPRQRSVAQALQQRYRLRWHGVLIGSFTLLLMWAASHVQMLLGVDTLAQRYLVTLAVGYVGYLLVLRLWAARLVQPRPPNNDRDGDSRAADGLDAALDLPWPGQGSGGGMRLPLPRTGGGDFGGGGASGDWGASESSVLGDLASGAADALGSTDEGAVVVVPVVAIFLIVSALLLGAGSLAMLFFGWDVLLTVAVELAFSVATARAAVGVERQGWLGAAVRLTWKPLLGALLCAGVLGASIDHFLPGAASLPQAVRILQGR